jgi:2-polyprenyl-6-methoxyphenol hydroxylase-like FAD-dependent oxidoreductase
VVDATIVGGGIGGCTLAIALRAAGWTVALAERTQRYRDRVRGEGVAPWGVAEATRLGVAGLLLEEAGARELPFWDTWHSALPRRDVLAQRDPHRRGVLTFRHHIAQAVLLDHAERIGVHVHRPAAAVPLRRHRGRWHVRAHGTEIRSRLLLIASGRPQSRGTRVHRDPVTHSVTGAILHAPHADPDAVATARTPHGRLLAFPLSDGHVRVYHMTATAPSSPGHAQARLLEDAAAAIPNLTEAATLIGPCATFPGASYWPQTITAEQAACIGDAAGVTDPSIGQGLSITFRDVRELVEALTQEQTIEDALARYCDARARYFATQRLVALVSWTLDQPGPDGDRARSAVASSDPERGRLLQEIRRDPGAVAADGAAATTLLGADEGDSSLRDVSQLAGHVPYSKVNVCDT